MGEEKDRVEINWVQVAGSVLAAMSSAVLLSTVGVAGTIIGAAIGSMFATAGSAIYQHYLRVSRARVAQAQALARQQVERARASVGGARQDARVRTGRDAGVGGSDRTRRMQAEIAQADDELVVAQDELDAAEADVASPPWREILAGLPWKRIAVVAAGIFVLAMAVILAFELLTGRAVSSYTGGSSKDTRTTLGGVAAPKTPGTPSDQATTDPTDGTTTTPSATPTSSASPSASASSSASSSASQAPRATPSTSASGSASSVPTPTPTVPTPTVPTPSVSDAPSASATPAG